MRQPRRLQRLAAGAPAAGWQRDRRPSAPSCPGWLRAASKVSQRPTWSPRRLLDASWAGRASDPDLAGEPGRLAGGGMPAELLHPSPQLGSSLLPALPQGRRSAYHSLAREGRQRRPHSGLPLDGGRHGRRRWQESGTAGTSGAAPRPLWLRRDRHLSSLIVNTNTRLQALLHVLRLSGLVCAAPPHPPPPPLRPPPGWRRAGHEVPARLRDADTSDISRCTPA